MEKLGLNEIRRLFREFYISKDHYPAKSASLIPRNDKSLLLINSGMAPLKPYFAGIETPPSKRMTTCQKCIRTGDIDNVGKTARHGTFFEMLGNFSFGDYFKKESLTWGWEFITQVLKMPEDKLWATVYTDDDEAYNIWKNDIGLPEERIVRLGKDDNFWEIGLGPCGPCSEIYFDRGEAYSCGSPDCKPGCECDRYIEFWNHVFTQFSKEEDGSYSNLEHPNIDTGMGLERLACIMQDVDSIFDIDTIRFILEGVVEVSGVEYKDGAADTDVSIRIITDHLRSMVFMIADGILPSNEGRGYVLRRLIRRAARHGKLLGVNGKFLTDLADRVIKVSGDAYPELVDKSAYIKKIISVEEDKFASTIDQGVAIIDGYIKDMEEKGETVLDGHRAFKLYDTYGFPLEVTEEILEEKGFTADTEGFDAEMKKQKEMARKGRKATEGDAWKEADIPEGMAETVFVGYETTQAEGSLLQIITEDGEVGSISYVDKPVMAKIFLSQTPFYAESGGQIYDTGVITKGDMIMEVIDVQKTRGVFVHTVKLLSGTATIGDELELRVNNVKRNMVARNHTATHLLHKALRETLGDHVQQAGSYVDENGLRFDFSHYQALTEEELKDVEMSVNLAINEFLPVSTVVTSIDKAKELGAMALFGEKYGDNVRVVSCGDYSIELCGGTHLANTGQAGAFKIMSETGVAAGVRRIEAVTGSGVYNLGTDMLETVDTTAQILKCNPDNLESKAEALMEELKSVKKELEELKKAAMGDAAGDLIKEAKEVNGIRLVTKAFDDLTVADLRNLSDDIKKDNKNVVMVFAVTNGDKVNLLVSVTDDLVEKGIHAGKMIKEIAAVCKGGGGGKADMAQAGGKDASKLPEAFALAETLLK